MWKHLRWYLFGTATVIFEMHDRERRFGWAKKTGGTWHGSPWQYINDLHKLHADGTVSGDGLVIGWEPCIGKVPYEPSA